MGRRGSSSKRYGPAFWINPYIAFILVTDIQSRLQVGTKAHNRRGVPYVPYVDNAIRTARDDFWGAICGRILPTKRVKTMHHSIMSLGSEDGGVLRRSISNTPNPIMVSDGELRFGLIDAPKLTHLTACTCSHDDCTDSFWFFISQMETGPVPLEVIPTVSNLAD